MSSFFLIPPLFKGLGRNREIYLGGSLEDLKVRKIAKACDIKSKYFQPHYALYFYKKLHQCSHKKTMRHK